MSDELSALPEKYCRYFELRRRGLRRNAIADRLEIPVDAVESFVELAHAKLAGVTVDPLRGEGESATMR